MKRMTMKFMALALLTFAGAASVYAQGVAFTSTSLPRQMRQEGITETAGEVVLTALNAGTIPSNSTIDFVFSAPITNNSTAVTNNISLANNITCAGPGFAGVCPAGIVSATLTGTNTVRLRFNAPVAFTVGDQINLSRIRVNANAAIGVGSVTVTMSGISSDPANFPISFTDPQRQVGVLNPTITANFNHSSSPNAGLTPLFRTCAFPNDAFAAVDDFFIRVVEVFPGALTTLAQEQAFSNALPPINGSNLTVTLTGVPAGFDVTSQTTSLANGSLSLLLGTAPPGTAFPQTVSQTTANTPIVFNYIVNTSDVSLVERITLNYRITPTTTNTTSAFLPTAALGTPATIQATVSVTPITTSDSTIVRFAANQIGPTTVATITDCTTRILMTWVATVADVETGVAINNTSSDDAAFGAGPTLGATAQNGTCTLTGYPSAGGTPVSFTTATINAGSSLAFLLSATTGFSNFTGYVLTVCNFEAAHAFTFITNGRGTVTGPTLAQGYVANIIQPGARPGALGFSESLGN